MAIVKKGTPLQYVPILKSKTGERWSLSKLKDETKRRIRPLIEFHAPKKGKELASHIETICSQMGDGWERQFYLDTVWIHGNPVSDDIFAAVHSEALDCGLLPIPVITPRLAASVYAAAREAIDAAGRGCLLRLNLDSLRDTDAIEAAIESVGLDVSSVDLLLDYRTDPMQLTRDVPRIHRIGEWRKFIAASGSFPASLADYPTHEWLSLERHDWVSWRNAVRGGLPRVPIFSDYTMRSPGAPSDFGEPPVALRYAATETWSVRIDGRHKNGDAPRMHAQCESLMARHEFMGEDFSAGDAEIVRTSAPDEGDGPGGPTQWLQWCANHHMEFVVNQLSAGEF